MKEVIVEAINPATNERVVHVVTVISEELLEKEVTNIINTLIKKDEKKEGQIALEQCKWKVNGEDFSR